MKRFICMLLLFALLASIVTSAYAEETVVPYPVVGGNIYFDTATGTIVYADDSVKEAVIPATINGVDVVEIGSYSFETDPSYEDTLKRVVLPDTVTKIGYEAFYYRTGLEEVIFSANLELIECDAFYNCSSLKNISLPDSLRVIEGQAFAGCELLTKVELPNGIEKVATCAFSQCTNLAEINLPRSVKSVGASILAETAFFLDESNWEDGCLYLDNWLLYVNKDGRTELEVQKGTIGIAGAIASNQTSIKEVNLPKSLKYVGTQAFSGCTGIEKIVFPENVEKLENGVLYYGNYNLKVYFKGDAPEIGSQSFFYLTYPPKDFSISPNLKLYYVEGKEGWTSPKWNGYPTSTWIPEAEPAIFDDVSDNVWYAEAVEYAVDFGLMNGTGNNKFEPETAMSRAMLVTVLWRYAGQPSEGKNTFTDVEDGKWFTQAVAWAAHNGIVGGVGNNKFDPNGNITREQMAAILYRYANSNGIDTSARADLSSFPDGGKVSRWASDALSWANAAGLITGTKINGTSYLDPQGEATRAQVATILMRFIENVIG